MRKIYSLFLQFIFTAVVCIALSCQHQANNQIKTSRISDRVIIYQYLNVNVTAIKSKNGILIIDSHRSPVTMKNIKRLIEKDFGRNDYSYIINTHNDHDHASGNQVFPNSTIIGHENCPKAMQQLPANSPEMISYIKSEINDMIGQEEMKNEMEIWKQMLASLENEYRVTPPNKTFSDSLTLRLDDLTVKIAYCGNAHTDNDIFIYIPEEELVITGDLFTSKNGFGFPINQMNDIQRVILIMEQIIHDPAGVKHVIPGHGLFFSKNDFVNLLDLLKEKFEKFKGKSSAVKLLESMIGKYGIKQAIGKYSQTQVSKNIKYYQSEDELSILGSRFLRKERTDEAIGVFTQSVKAFPKSALGYDNLGGAYLKKGEIDSAIIYLKKSLQIFPENRNTQEILKTIDHAK